MATANGQEPGYDGVLVSLGGVKGIKGQGRVTVEDTITLTAAGLVYTIPANLKRISLLIQNHYTSSDILKFSFGGDNATGAKTLQIGDTLQIDSLLPWTGAVTLATPAGATTYIVYVETSVV